MSKQQYWVRKRDGSYGPRKHWYFITTFYCPLCGSTREIRDRRYGRRPKDEAQRRQFIEDWDGCGI